jgi:hypothetical protein
MFPKDPQRFPSLCKDLEEQVQGLLAPSDVARIEAALKAALARKGMKAIWEQRLLGGKIFYYYEFAELLIRRIQQAGSEVFKRIRDEEIGATAVPIDGRVEHPAGDMPSSAITDEMFIGEDACIHQSRNNARKWKSVYLWGNQIKSSNGAEGERAADLAAASNGGQATTPTNGYASFIVDAAKIVFPKGPPASLNGMDLKRALMPTMREMPGFNKDADPKPRSFNRALKKHPRGESTLPKAAKG